MSRVATRSLVALVAAVALPWMACENPDDGKDYSPSLTMIRTERVVVEDPPPIPEALWIPGINIKSEDYELADASAWFPAVADLQNMREIDDPEPLEKHKDYDYAAGTGSLFDEVADEGDLRWDDTEQGAMGDCYFPAALSAALFIDEDDAIKDGLIREVRDDGGFLTHYVVRFYDAWGTPQDIEVDADLVRKGSKVTYMRSLDTRSGKEEWWPSLVEKAYAEWHGGYPEIGDGGWVGDVFQALTGSNANYRTLKYMSDKTVVDSITRSIEQNKPVAAGTFGKDDGVDYEGTKIYAWHAYSVLGAGTDEDGDMYVTLRNPWGEVEPPDNGPDDGIFDLKMSEFKRLYQGVTFGGGHTVDHTAPDAVTDLLVVDILEDSVVVTFTATGDDEDEGLAAKYDLRVCTEPVTSSNFYSCEAVAVAGPQMPGTEERIEVTGLDGEGTYHFALKVEDESENISALSNVVEATLGATGDDDDAGDDDAGDDDDSTPDPIDLLEDFEGGASGWTMTGLWHLSDLEATSGTWSAWFGSDATLNYDTGSQEVGTLQSPTLDLTYTPNPTLSWQQLLDCESGPEYDQAKVEVSTEAGGYADWTTVWEKDDTNDTYLLMQVSLAAYAGQKIQVRFHFDSIDEVSNDYLGWFVDDVWVTGQ